MKLIVNDNVHIDIDYSQCIIKQKRVDKKGKPIVENVGYYTTLNGALKGAFRLCGLKGKVKLNDLDKKIDDSLESFVEGLKLDLTPPTKENKKVDEK